MTLVLIVAGMLILGEFAVIILLLRFVRTFGVYAPQLVEIHKTNIQIIERQEALMKRLPFPPDDEELVA